MSLKLNELTTDAEFGPICAVELEAFTDPFFGFWGVWKGSSQEEFCARQLSWHKGDPSSHWIYVTDVETGDVIAGTQWMIYEENPYAKETSILEPYWIPEGTFKDIASQLLHTFLSYRPTRMNEPHLLLNFCFVHTKHRRRGAGRLMMEWGLKKADELGLASFVEATDSGLKLYREYGFKVEGDIDLDATTENPSEEFTRLRKELRLPEHGWFMRRPKYGKSEVALHQARFAIYSGASSFPMVASIRADINLLISGETKKAQENIQDIVKFHITTCSLLKISFTTNILGISVQIRFVNYLKQHGLELKILVYRVSGVRITLLGDGGADESKHGGVPIPARSEWAPHIDFVDVKAFGEPHQDRQLYAPALGELTTLAISLSKQLAAGITEVQIPHLKKYNAWLDQQAPSNFDTSTLTGRINSIGKQLAESPATGAAAALAKVSANAVAILSAEKGAFETLNADDTLNKINKFMKESYPPYASSNPLQAFAYSNPRLWVLELGASYGTATPGILKNPRYPNGQLLYS
ncbi:hypothetical protein G7Y89_g13316 [Cudoniella acicularis]|uniref:N-acetyltransferase domain-containing protein n=1 Tax=Cudoniella acicularis TaxID=354080 RepID=A0A8H4VWJ7_9HELO|nr:hypothetical protein G7Y89_g13316 [Cudoniella acicularis]